MGHREAVCPFYLSRAIIDETDIVFCPYNYLIDPNIRQAMKINLESKLDMI